MQGAFGDLGDKQKASMRRLKDQLFSGETEEDLKPRLTVRG